MIEYYDQSIVPVCLTTVDVFWHAFFFVFSTIVFFFLPLLILIILYTIIAKHLMENPGIISQGHRANVLKYRKQVIFMLGTVVLSFFICLLPFRALTLWIIAVPQETLLSLGIEGYYNLLYFSRTMHYLNSALNPILYNLMSSKFREGFLRLLGCKSRIRKKHMTGTRKGTFHTTSTNLSSTNSDKQRSKRRSSNCRTTTTSQDESCSIMSEPNGCDTVFHRNLSFEEASNNIVQCAKAILVQGAAIEEVDENITDLPITPKKDTDDINSYQSKSLDCKKSSDFNRNNNIENDSCIIENGGIYLDFNDQTNGDHESILAPLLCKIKTFNDDGMKDDNGKSEEAIIRSKLTEECNNVEYLENILPAKESLV